MNLCKFIDEIAVCKDHGWPQAECEMFEISRLSSGVMFADQEYKLCRYRRGHHEHIDKTDVNSREYYSRCQHPDAAVIMKMEEL